MKKLKFQNPTSVRLSRSLGLALRQYAREREVSESDVVRIALKEFLIYRNLNRASTVNSNLASEASL